jgi:hypothetical protein
MYIYIYIYIYIYVYTYIYIYIGNRATRHQLVFGGITAPVDKDAKKFGLDATF